MSILFLTRDLACLLSGYTFVDHLSLQFEGAQIPMGSGLRLSPSVAIP